MPFRACRQSDKALLAGQAVSPGTARAAPCEHKTGGGGPVAVVAAVAARAATEGHLPRAATPSRGPVHTSASRMTSWCSGSSPPPLALLLVVMAVTPAALGAATTTTTTSPSSTTTISPALLAALNELDEQAVWWQYKALEAGETMAKSLLEDPSRREPVNATTWGWLTPKPGKPPIVGTANLAAEHGYAVENYTVRTPDGYLLGLFRLPNPGKPVVLLAHGLLSSSADFLVLGKGRALGFVLHDAGFDVWMYNARGTTPSRRHEYLHPWKAKFWDFSLHEIALGDLPATIDFVLKNTGQPQLHYVGYCQGSTLFFILGSERTEYMDKVKSFVGLAPVAYLRDIRSLPLRLMAAAPYTLYFLLKLVGLNEFLPNNKFMSLVGEVMCNDNEITQPICTNIIFMFFGHDTEQMNQTALPDLMANMPAGASTKQMLHFGQQVNHRHLVFKMFDYGRLGNLRKYHSFKAPEYDLTRITVPTYMFYSENDLLCVQSNIDELIRKLPNIQKDGVRKINNNKFNHIGYLLAKNAKELVFDDVVDVLKKMEASQPSSATPGSSTASTASTGSTSSTASTASTASTGSTASTSSGPPGSTVTEVSV